MWTYQSHEEHAQNTNVELRNTGKAIEATAVIGIFRVFVSRDNTAGMRNVL